MPVNGRVTSGLKLATIRGIDLRIHGSLVFLLSYVVLVASVQFPFVAARSGVKASDLFGGSLFWAVLFALGLFVSVALHEFGHALTAQAQGIKVRGIVLMMLGGVSQMEKIPERPWAEFKLAVVGPLVSLALGTALLFLPRHLGSPELLLYGYWLGRANIALGIFNLLPAFPLDGGRALRSVLAVKMGSLRATQLAVRISQGFAWGLGLLGLFAFNLLLVLIAFFVHSAAKNELYLLVSAKLLEGLTVAQAATVQEALPVTATIGEAAQAMLHHRTTVLPVRLAPDRVGVISLQEVRRVPREHWGRIPLEHLAMKCNRVVHLEEALAELLAELAAAPAGALPVVQGDGRIIGVLKASDVSDLIALRGIERESAAREESRAGDANAA